MVRNFEILPLTDKKSLDFERVFTTKTSLIPY